MNSVSSGSPSPPQGNSTMSLRQHLQETVHDVFFQKWTEREGRQIPEDTSVQLGNDAVKIDATVLYDHLSRRGCFGQTSPSRVVCFDDRVLVVASAGSGKTSTMVAKAAPDEPN